MLIGIDSSVYDAILFSGYFSDLDIKTQSSIIKLSSTIKEHNLQFKCISNLKDRFYLNGQNFSSDSINSIVKENYRERKYIYETIIVIFQKEIILEIANLERLLEIEIRNNKMFNRKRISECNSL